MALSAERRVKHAYVEPGMAGLVMVYPVADAVEIFKGAWLHAEADGYAAPCGGTIVTPCIGKALENVDNSGGANGDLKVKILTLFIAKFLVASETIADVGKQVYCVDDEVLSFVSTTNEPFGMIIGFDEIDGVHVIQHLGALGTG